MAIQIDRVRVLGRTVISATLLDGVSATSDGNWLNVLGMGPFTVHVKGITNATVRLHGSNDPTQPSDATAEIQIGRDITSDVLIEVVSPMNWFKASIPVYVSGTISVYFTAQK